MQLLSTITAAALLFATPAPPFAVGERLEYDARMGILPVGSATLSVAAAAQSRGIPVWKFTLDGSGGPPGGRTTWALASWTEQARFVSHRFHRQTQIAGRSKDEQFEIVADSQLYRVAGEDGAWVAPDRPLDELAMLYYLRTLTVQPGGRRELRGYFRNGWNPVVVRDIGRATVRLGNGREATCQRLRVTAAGAHSDICLTTDARRIPAEVTVPMSFGRVTFVWEGS